MALPPVKDAPVPKPPPLNTTWPGLFKSLRREVPSDPALRSRGEPATHIEGEIPEGLNGDLLIQGPVEYSVLGAPARSWFDGQGGIHRVRINGQQATQWSRIVRSDDYKQEEASGVQLVNHFATNAPTVEPFSGARTFNTANTQAMVWQDEVYALYEGGLPVRLDGETLDTIEETRLLDANGKPLLREDEHLSAHFHWHPRSRSIIDYGLLPHLHLKPCRNRIDTTQLRLYRFPQEPGKPAEDLVDIDLPFYPWLHDFIVTDRYAVFLIPPVRVDLWRMMNNRGTLADNYYWQQDGRTRLVVVDLDDPSRVTNTLLEPGEGNPTGGFWQWHFANAFEEDGWVKIDFMLYDDYESGVKDFNLSVHRGRYPATVQPSRFVRAAVKQSDGKHPVKPETFRIRTLADLSCEFCRVSDAVLTRPYRYAYSAGHSSRYASYNTLWDSVVKYDVKGRTARRYRLGDEQSPSEPIFVPRPGGEAEDDGWLLNVVYDGIRHRSYVAILDATKLLSDAPGDDPPPSVPAPPDAWVARIWLPERIPQTFHRIWTGIGGQYPVTNR